MDPQAFPHFSFEGVLENVDKNLVYDPITKKICFRTNQDLHDECFGPKHNEEFFQNYDKNCELNIKNVEADTNSDSHYDSGFPSDSYIENLSQKLNLNDDSSNVEINSVHTNDLDILNSVQLASKRSFLSNILNKLSISSATNKLTENNETSGNNSISSNLLTSTNNTVPLDIVSKGNITLGKRPSNLPPKTEKEELKHIAEFNEILRYARKKELKEIKTKKRVLSKQIRQEEQVREAILCWTNEILPSWSISYNSKKARDLWWNGIPSPIRPKVWSLAIGDDLSITDELFRICVERSKERIWTKQFISRRSSNPNVSKLHLTENKHRRSNSSTSSCPIGRTMVKCIDTDKQEFDKNLKPFSSKDKTDDLCAKIYESEEDEEEKNESTAFLISLDVSRTFPHLGLFQELGPYHKALSDILSAYAVYRPDLGYCQGMSFLAAMLLLNLDSPSIAFTAFANLLNNELLLSFYRLNENNMQIVYSYYDRQLQVLLPKLARHFASIGLSTDLFLVYQIYTIFSRSLTIDCACRVWDLFLRDGNEFIFRASLAILAMYEDDLLGMEFVNSAQFLSQLPTDMDIETYFNHIASIKLAPPKLSVSFEHQKLQQTKTRIHSSNSSSFVKKLFQF